jgi:hypothetical protein
MTVPDRITPSMNDGLTWWMSKFQDCLLDMPQREFLDLIESECCGRDSFEAAENLKRKGWNVNGYLVIVLMDVKI